MAIQPRINPTLVNLLIEKAKHSDCTHKVSAVAFDKKGNVLGHVTNKHAAWNVVEKTGTGRAGTARHAERILISRYGQNIKSILICRIGNSGALLPIDPCPSCRKVANKYGIKIYSISSACC